MEESLDSFGLSKWICVGPCFSKLVRVGPCESCFSPVFDPLFFGLSLGPLGPLGLSGFPEIAVQPIRKLQEKLSSGGESRCPSLATQFSHTPPFQHKCRMIPHRHKQSPCCFVPVANQLLTANTELEFNFVSGCFSEQSKGDRRKHKKAKKDTMLSGSSYLSQPPCRKRTLQPTQPNCMRTKPWQ